MYKLIRLIFILGIIILFPFGCSDDNDTIESTNSQSTTTSTVTDADGNVYKTVKIGTQVWMAENLKTTTYNDGTLIPNVTDDGRWWALNDGGYSGYCFYNNDSKYRKYGCLYNWNAVNTGKLAPKGWHVPTNNEWIALENYLIENGYNYDGTTYENYFAKALAATTDWERTPSNYNGAIGCDLTKNNKTGFSALPAGKRGFSDAGSQCYWWSSTGYNATLAWIRELTYDDCYLVIHTSSKSMGYSVRCIKDN